MKSRIFGDKKGGGANGIVGVHAEFGSAVRPNAEFKFSKISGDHDFHLMISKE